MNNFIQLHFVAAVNLVGYICMRLLLGEIRRQVLVNYIAGFGH